MDQDIAMLQRLRIPEGVLDIVIDSDAFNEVDDQFAIVYALRSSKRFNVKSIYASPFYKPEYNDRSDSPRDGMQKSYDEILRLLSLAGESREGLVYRGATAFTKDNPGLAPCEATENLISLAMDRYTPDRPLIYVSIACLTNLALAIAIEPLICDRLHVIWLGGLPHAAVSTSEFNLHQDIEAVRAVFASGVALTQVPCYGVASHLLTSIHELQNALDPTIPVNRYLLDTFRGYYSDHFAYSKEIWDIGPIGYLMNPEEWGKSHIVHRPLVTFDESYSMMPDTQFMRVLYSIDRNSIFRDLFAKLNSSPRRR